MTNLVFDVLSSLFAALMVDGGTGEIKEANTSFSLLTGWQRKDLLGKSLDTVIPERSRAVHRSHQATFMENPAPRPMGADREVWMLCKDGSEALVWIGLSGDIGDGLIVATILPRDVARPGPLNP